MTLQNIALIGKARSGKDTIAAELVRSHQYTRIAFADPLKEMALRIDPIVYQYKHTDGWHDKRLSEMVSNIGWETAKDKYPEVRRFLQMLGQSIREEYEDFWLNIALGKVRQAQRWNMPVVITDVRYANEAAALECEGFKLVRIMRPGQDPISGSNHASETELDRWDTHVTTMNNGTLADLQQRARQLPLTATQ
ncbi:hypothetical protein [Streptomyces sp. NBC_01180]|uniref:deoxynucleotide monophosphate kinase family protein n=1 Tax=Streptomyces sp. NBC_01180 TaxID=2903763 RepID=UPI0038674E03|nr:hypothetical protein OG708_09030 [Streptomyces sp. NBC_01180]